MEEAAPSLDQPADGSTHSTGATSGANLFAGSPDPFADLLSPSSSSSPGKRTSPGQSQATTDLFATEAASQRQSGDEGNDRGALVRTSTTPVVAQHRAPERYVLALHVAGLCTCFANVYSRAALALNAEN